MIDSNETAYPTLPRHASGLESFTVTEDELAFVKAKRQTCATRLSLLAMLKCHQYLNRLPGLDSLPDALTEHFRSVIPCKTADLRDDPQTRHRNLTLIRELRGMTAWSSEFEPEMTGSLRETKTVR